MHARALSLVLVVTFLYAAEAFHSAPLPLRMYVFYRTPLLSLCNPDKVSIRIYVYTLVFSLRWGASSA